MKEIKFMHKSKLNENIDDFLSEFPLFWTLTADELKIVAEHMNLFEIEKGEILFKEGDKGDYVCFILKGTIDIIKESSSGDDVVVASLSKGRSIGELSFIDYSPRSAKTRAQTKTSFLALTKIGFDKIQKDYPEIAIIIFKGISKLLCLNLRKTTSQLADYMTDHLILFKEGL